MAHLFRCWCGKTFRCEMDHSSNGKLRTIDDRFHDECPDFTLHGQPDQWLKRIKEEEYGQGARP